MSHADRGKHAVNMREVFVATMSKALDVDPRLVVVAAEISVAQLSDAISRHPHRVVNVGIREQLMISVAGGLALTGMRPVVHTFPSFLVERPYEQIKLDLSHQGVGAVLVSSGASYDMASAGRTHQSPADVTLLDAIPGWTIHVPGHPEEARRLLLESLPGNSQVYLRLSAANNRQPWLGNGFQLVRDGKRLVVVAVGPMLDPVLAATQSMDAKVLYTSTVRPFDARGLRAAVQASDSTDIVVVEPYLAGTSAHEIAGALADVPHRQLGLGVRRDSEVRIYGEMSDHDIAHGLDEASIAASIKRFIDR